MPRALLDLAADGSAEQQLTRLITEAIHLRKLRHHEMRALLAAHPRHRGIRVLKRAYAAYMPRPSARSGLERAFDEGLERRPWIPQPEANVYVPAGGIAWEIDRLWREYGFGLELDGGGYHDAAADREKDHTKAAKLLIAGVALLHVTDERFELEPGRVYDDIERILSSRGWPGRQPA